MKKTKKILSGCRFHLVSFVVGVLFCAIVFSLAEPALAALTQKTISIHTGITIFVDDQKIDPKDANGNTVEPFLYNGTTYLPVRALSKAIGKPITWEGSTHSVYVGKHKSTTPSIMLKDLDYLTGSKSLSTVSIETDNYGNTHSNVITEKFDRTYNINCSYSLITGTVYQTYNSRSNNVYAKWAKLEIYGDGRLLYAYSLPEDTTTVNPQSFSVDLTGVIELRVVFSDGDNYSGWGDSSGRPLSLGDCGLFS